MSIKCVKGCGDRIGGEWRERSDDGIGIPRKYIINMAIIWFRSHILTINLINLDVAITHDPSATRSWYDP